MSESVESYGDEEPSINTVVKLIRTLQHSTDRDAVIDAIEDLRTQARGNGMLGLNQFVPEQINWLFLFHAFAQSIPKLSKCCTNRNRHIVFNPFDLLSRPLTLTRCAFSRRQTFSKKALASMVAQRH
jgi:hypothetical protein